MVDRHSKSFFGKSSGLTIQSSSLEEDFIFFKCIQKKPNGAWEKPSIGEGKIIKINLEEMVMILEILNKNLINWSSYHSFRNIKTPISFKWENERKDKLYINIGKYSKMLTFSQVEILRLLMEHLLKEKIEHATILKRSNSKKQDKTLNSKYSEKSNQNGTPITPIEGSIKGETEKALLINFDDDHRLWIPKSAISSDYNSNDDMVQTFHIATWLLKKNNVIML